MASAHDVQLRGVIRIREVNERLGAFGSLDPTKRQWSLDKDGTCLFDKPLPQDEAKLREVFTRLQTQRQVLVIVDQPNTIGALPVAVARDTGCVVDKDSEVLASLKVLAGYDDDLARESTRSINPLRSLLL